MEGSIYGLFKEEARSRWLRGSLEGSEAGRGPHGGPADQAEAERKRPSGQPSAQRDKEEARSRRLRGSLEGSEAGRGPHGGPADQAEAERKRPSGQPSAQRDKEEARSRWLRGSLEGSENKKSGRFKISLCKLPLTSMR